MTHKEFLSKISNHNNPKWFKEIVAVFIFDHLNITQEIKSLSSIRQYVERQVKGWESIEKSLNLPQEFKTSQKLFERLLTNIDSFIESSVNWDEKTLNAQWRQGAKSQIELLNSQKAFLPNDKTTSFLLDQSKLGKDQFDGAYTFLIDKQKNPNINTPSKFEGMLRAYEFENNGSSLSKKSRYEKGSLTTLKQEFEKHFNSVSVEVEEFLRENSSKSGELSKSFNQLLEDKRTEFDLWLSEAISNEKGFSSNAAENIINLETLYREKLMLEAPAEYWRKRASELRKSGLKWIYAFSAGTVISVLLLILVLYFISNGVLLEVFSKTGSAIKWSIVFITLISFLAFGIRTFIRLGISAFHLARDAEEREQLVYVYLSLKKDDNIKEEERILILQSIFSRADTGLLREDSAPTMPGSSGLIEKVFSK